TGPGNVRKAMRRSGKNTFWEIYPYLHRDTRAYVPQYVAVTYVMNYLEEHNFVEDQMDFLPEYDTVMVSGYLHVQTLAESLGLCLDDLEQLNPGIKYNVLGENNKPVPLRVPTQTLDYIQSNKIALFDSAGVQKKNEILKLASNTVGSTYGKDKIVYRVRSGDVLGKIASNYNVKVSDLKRWNNLRSDMIRVGQKLDIWLKPSQFKSYTAQTKPTETKPQVSVDANGIKTYTVQPGDTLWDISKKFQGISIDRIKQLNGLSSDNIKPGQKLKIG
ncbi:MAG: LysM peptidoglycan-binding domain-containing protein, partial [Cyclobacteriaceae bacterium]|nr:LysM peptidoglycan-binding domain-containing protein [Cyclobacteriaceae bacterium]